MSPRVENDNLVGIWQTICIGATDGQRMDEVWFGSA